MKEFIVNNAACGKTGGRYGDSQPTCLFVPAGFWEDRSSWAKRRSSFEMSSRTPYNI